MTCKYSLHRVRALSMAEPSSKGDMRRASGCRTCPLFTIGTLLLFLAWIQLIPRTVGQATTSGPYSQNKDTIIEMAKKLESLHKQGDSGPQWMDIVKSRGFTGELYTTLSLDNNPISIYHIINPLADQRRLNRYPALMFHGILMDAAQAISHSENARPRAPVEGKLTVDPSDTSLAFMLANNNFDVWMCDARGTNLNNHLVSDDLNPLQAQKFWNFSLDEQVHYDLPVIVDFVLAQTNSDKLHYVGYSESTFMMFALLSSRVEYQDKLASYTALAPVAYVEHLEGLGFNMFMPVTLIPESINGNFVPQLFSDTVGSTLRQLCQTYLFSHTLCPGLVSVLGGVGDNALSTEFYSSAGKSTSIKAVRHFLQLYAQRRFGMYDYGLQGNMRQYGQSVPPDYPLANIKLPSILLVRGGSDFLSTPGDQERLLAELGAKPYLDLYYPDYNHLDFLIGNSIEREVNLPAARMMLDWSREWARRAGLPNNLRDSSSLALSRGIAPVSVGHPSGSRALAIKSNLLSNLINGLTQTTSQKIVDGGTAQLLTGFVSQPRSQAPGPILMLSNLIG